MATALQDQQLADARIFTPAPADIGGTLSGSGAQGYWRKKDGEITFGAFTVNGMRSYTRKKYLPLMDYPQFTNDKNKATGFDPMLDPFRPLLERGGIKEFALPQIVELGWHRKPHRILQAQVDRLVNMGHSAQEALEAVIPQLVGFERVDVPCPLCPGRVFNSDDELSRHEILHKDDVQTRRLGDAITKALSGSQAASNDTLAPIVKMLADAISALSVNQSETTAALANTQALIARTLAAGETSDTPKK